MRLVRAALVVALMLASDAVSTAAADSDARGTEPARVARRDHEVIVVLADQTLFFENIRPLCTAWTVPGQWQFARQRAALRSADGKFVGVALYPESQFAALPGADVVARAVEGFRQAIARDHGTGVATTVEPFTASPAGAVVFRVTTPIDAPPALVAEHPGLAGTHGFLPTRVFAAHPPGWVSVITLMPDQLDLARAVLDSLRTTEEPRCWWPLLKRQFPDIRW